MGRRGGNEVTEVTPKHTKNQWDADTDSNTYDDRIKSEYCGILLWTQHQNIHRTPRKGCDSSQILYNGTPYDPYASKVSCGVCGQSAAVKGKPNNPPNDPRTTPRTTPEIIFFQRWWPLHLQPQPLVKTNLVINADVPM